VFGVAGYSSMAMGPLCGLRLGQNASLPSTTTIVHGVECDFNLFCLFVSGLNSSEERHVSFSNVIILKITVESYENLLFCYYHWHHLQFLPRMKLVPLMYNLKDC